MKLFEKNELRLLWPFYLEAFFGTFLLILPPFMVIYFSSLGLSLTQIGILLAAAPLASLLFEIPTGAIADLYGRKFSVITGWLLTGITLIAIYFTSSYYYLLLLNFILGVFSTFSSGSYDAWAVDLLRGKKMNDFINKYFTKKQSLYNLAIIFSGLIGAFLVAKFGLSIIWPVSGFAFFLSVFFLYFGEEVHEKKSMHVRESFKNITKQIKESVSYSSRHHVLFFILIISFIITIFGVFNGFISWTPLLKSFNFPESSFGYIWSASGVLGIIAPFLSNRILKKNKERNLLVISSFAALVYSILFITANTLAIIISLIILFYFIMDFSAPVEITYFHRFIPSKLRATIGSIQNVMTSIGGIIALPLVGFLVDKIGGRLTIFISGLLMIPVIILYLMIKEKGR